MPPIYVKGGLWTNVEDEILKAAVSKYGPNQWSRVSSLLAKKTAKQAKARWQEYLNPVVNKSEWTREEDEKLLRLAKLVPNQWRSIAPIMGRTATACVERYQKLLDDASGYQREDDQDEEDELNLAGAGIESMPSAGNSIVGDLNIHPESKPARPDEEDMDEEEREMLSEARARLANTQGKKAKRKARERMLEETKRISQLQKRRELKAAGIKVSIESKNKKKRKEFDYNADIPHEVTPQKGLYDVEEEIRLNLADQSKFSRSVQDLGIQVNDKEKKKKRDRSELKGNKDDRKRIADDLEGEAKDYAENINVKRKKLALPAPDTEMDEQADQDKQTVDSDIDSRILKATLELKSNQKQKSSLIAGGQKDGTLEKENVKEREVELRAEVRARPKSLRAGLGALQKQLRALFSKLPQPVRNPQIILPSLDQSEEVTLTSGENRSDERFRNIELLKRQDEEKALNRRSLVVKRGFKIPNPGTIKQPVKELRGLDFLIFKEVEQLLKSDYKRYLDPTYEAELLEDLNEVDFENASREISQELLSGSKQDLKLFAKHGLTETFEAAEAIIYKLHDFANDAARQEAEITESLKYEEYSKEAERLRSNIERLSTESLELDTLISNSTQLQYEEETAIEARTSRMQSLIDKLVQGEQVASSLLREKRK